MAEHSQKGLFFDGINKHFGGTYALKMFRFPSSAAKSSRFLVKMARASPL